MIVEPIYVILIFAAFLFGCFVGMIYTKSISGQSRLNSSSPANLRLNDLSTLDKKVDLLLSHFGLEPPVEIRSKNTVITSSKTVQNVEVPPEVMAYLPDKKIEAIKVLRESTGLGLAECKDIVDGICMGLKR